MDSAVMGRHQIRMCEGDRKVRRSNQVVVRRWNEMPHDILVDIIRRLPWQDLALRVCYLCRSWQSALLDAMFPPGNVLDLRPIDSFDDRYWRRRFRHYLKLVLDRRPTTVWTKIYLAKTRLQDEALTYIAERSPLMHYLIVPRELDIFYPRISRLLPYWKNLRGVLAGTRLTWDLRIHCKFISELSLYGQICDRIASLIAKKFPQLKYLVIRSCRLSVNALPVILDGHKNLLLLDTRHCYCLDKVSTQTMYSIEPPYTIGGKYLLPWRAKEWNEEVINQKAAGIKLHLQCARNHCSQCCHLY